jgi:hypothetical protein
VRLEGLGTLKVHCSHRESNLRPPQVELVTQWAGPSQIDTEFCSEKLAKRSYLEDLDMKGRILKEQGVKWLTGTQRTA